MKSFWMGILIGGLVLTAFDLFACPSGQTCPAGKDCVADSSLCVADSSSTTKSGDTSTEPTTVKDQLGLTLDPLANLHTPQVGVGSAGSGVETLGFEVDMGVSYRVNPQVAVGSTMGLLFSSDVILRNDAQNAPIPDESAWVWGVGPAAKF